MNNTDAKLKEAAKRNAEKIAGSHVFLALFNEAMLEDPICLLQMGLAIYLDKPIYLLVPQDTIIPDNLRRVARKIEYYWRNPEDMSSIEQATERLLSDLKEDSTPENRDGTSSRSTTTTPPGRNAKPKPGED